jgi:23S rRNA pseudouridine1911/1915/1917 synthase
MNKEGIENVFDVLYEDNHLIAVNKYSGILVQGDNTGDKPLAEYVKEFLKKKYDKTGNVFCGVIHRIDRPVSGLVLLAKTSKALERMNKQFADKVIQKTYLAVVQNQPPKSQDTLVHWLTKDAQKNQAKAYTKEVKQSKYCELSYQLIGQSDRYFLVQVKPVTGRAHQIRCQLSAIGCSIKGDLKYGSPRSNSDGRIHLHAYKLQFTHPVSSQPMEITCPLPDETLWNYFNQVV